MCLDHLDARCLHFGTYNVIEQIFYDIRVGSDLEARSMQKGFSDN